MKIRVEVTKGQRAVLEPKGFMGAVTGQGQALYGDSAVVEFKDEMAAQLSSELVEIIEAMGKAASDAVVAVADKTEAVG